MDAWEKNITRFNRHKEGMITMKEYMIRRKWGILPRKEGGSAPGAGGIFWYYVKDVDEVEGDEEEEEIKENEIANTFLTGLKEGNAPVEFTKM